VPEVLVGVSPPSARHVSEVCKTSHWALPRGGTSAAMIPMANPCIQGLGGVAWHWHRLGIRIGLCIGHGPCIRHHSTTIGQPIAPRSQTLSRIKNASHVDLRSQISTRLAGSPACESGSAARSRSQAGYEALTRVRLNPPLQASET
jgi:hypothetical protein